MKSEKILITGALGQLGTVLTNELQKKYGINSVIATDLRPNFDFNGVFETLDVTNFKAIEECVIKHNVTQIYHLAAILSANGEKNPLKTWDINMSTLFNVLEVSRLCNINKIFYPSSIAVFGDEIESVNTPQSPNLTPLTVYGMSKVAGENWVNYYHKRYGLDIRSLRYPGVIGYQSLPGGGTTDYAVDIYHKAVNNEDFECFLKASTMLPMIFIDDAIRATLELMDAPRKIISIRTSYNLAGMSFTPNELYNSIRKTYPDFKISYNPDFRQEIADSWPKSIDDNTARKDWGWKPNYDLDSMTNIMIQKLKAQYHSVVA
ncbi:NAD-dependent epimerase/dehydratase family protein [Polaribacter sp. Z022]|uniref:NAD-dependent epimerase/dehydratase family protein n=1 Tax=Polaribacter sp. Z022 TaxID=2927125 RepID=UPI0020213350|nr:NAD-dependent epimerase/dehydratase family protein [Polaribacter sp. Z022]MCL7752920.1 NAD-dependent epimerase/dehydratase family protein [Polaribacter sp. Z022]